MWGHSFLCVNFHSSACCSNKSAFKLATSALPEQYSVYFFLVNIIWQIKCDLILVCASYLQVRQSM